MDSISAYWTYAIVALTAAVIHYHIKAFSFWSSRGVKGPTPWPIFGTNIYYIFGHKLEVDRKWREKYGHTYGLYEGYYPLLRTTDNELLKLVYVKQFDSFTDRHTRFIYGEAQNNWMVFSKGSRWSNQRVLVSPMFSSAKMRTMFPTMSQCVDKFINFANERIKQAGASLDGKHPKMATFHKVDVTSMTIDLIAACFFSLKLSTYDLAKNEFLRRAYSFTSINPFWFFAWLFIPRFLAKRFEINLLLDSKIDYFYNLAKQMIDERRSNKVAKKNDILQALMEAKLPDTYEQVFSSDDDKEAHYNQISHQELEGVLQEQTQQAQFKRFSDAEIKGQIGFMILAGFDTTAATINFSLFELAHQPKIQEKLFDELSSKFGAEAIELGSLNLTKESYMSLQDLKLLDSFVSEVLRLYSPVLDHNRSVIDPAGFDLPISDSNTIHLPYGTPITTNGFILQRDPDYFERPDEFDLMRFHPDNRHKIKTATFMPFGLGPRHCAGMRFALLEVKLSLVKFIALYRVTPAPKNRDYPPKFQHNAVFLHFENSDFNLTPRFGLN